MTKKKSKSHPHKSVAEEAGIDVNFFSDVFEQDFSNRGTQLVGAIDQGTSSTRFLLFSAKGRIVASAQMEHEQIYPHPGWHEHDPQVLWSNTQACIAAVCHRLQDKVELNRESLAALGITNQRETTLAWNRVTGKPYYHAIVWDDTRTAIIAHDMKASGKEPALTKITGLPLSSYFAGTKVKWLLDNVEQLRNDVRDKPDEVCFGTVDTWLLYQLTGEVPKSKSTGRKLKGAAGAFNRGGCFQTDVTNASRWLFMDIESCQWHEPSIATIVAPHNLPITVLPTIRPSSHVFGHVADCGLPSQMVGVKIAAVLGDQQAALFGQAAYHAGQAKNTYGTGLFLMMNTGTTAVRSTHGLLTTVAYQLSQNDQSIHYALEGSVSHSGSTLQWLRDQLQIIDSAAASEPLARSVVSSEGMYFVPAFAGLFAPHWRSDARACIVGLQMSHNKAHLCRAALEATAYQTKEVFDAIVKDTAESIGLEGLKSLNVDGGGTNNKLLMQFQADIINVPIVKPVVMETTSMGVAFAAGLAVGVWKDLDEIEKLWAVAETYQPQMTQSDRDTKLRGWTKALTKSLDWVTDTENNDTELLDATLTSSNDDNQVEPSLGMLEEPNCIKTVVDVKEQSVDTKVMKESPPDAAANMNRHISTKANEAVDEKTTENALQLLPLAMATASGLLVGTLLGVGILRRR